MVQLQHNISLADKTTFRIGGPTRYYYEPVNIKEIKECIRLAKFRGLPLFIMGKGSNLLISDSGWPGLTLNVSAKFTNAFWKSRSVICQAGMPLNQLVIECARMGLSGIECLAGIPGTLGGAVVMNAGAFGHNLSECVNWVQYFDIKNQKILKIKANECKFGYRTSIFLNSAMLILTVQCRFSRADPDKLKSIMRDIINRRAVKQPLKYPNCGSVFKNPPGDFSGRLIEECGLKGYRIKDAQISHKHANFIVNRGSATASDVRRLICYVQKQVFEKTGVYLQPEVIFIGEFNEPLFKPPT